MEQQPEKETLAEISFDDFTKLDLRTARVIDCKKVEGADKLLLFDLDLGTEQRQIVSGIAKWYQPADLIGKNVVIVANLAPRKIRGIMSQGMILSAEDGDTISVLTTLSDVAGGSKVC